MNEQEVKMVQGQAVQEYSVPVENPVQTEQPAEKPDDPNEVKKYKNMLVLNMVVVIALFIAWFVFRNNIIISLFAMILCALPLKDASTMLKSKGLMQRNGMQRGNIVGIAVLAVIDVVLWIGLFVYQLLHLTD